MDIWQHLEQQITRTSGSRFQIRARQSVAGGCINSAFRVTDNQKSYFIKTNSASHAYMFQAEAESLREMAGSGTVRVPEPVCYGEFGNQCYVVMEYLELGGSAYRARDHHLPESGRVAFDLRLDGIADVHR